MFPEAVVRVAFAGWTAALAGLGLAGDLPTLTAAAILFGLGMGLAVPAFTVLVGEAAPAELRGRATALLATATFTGQLAAPLLLGPLIAATSIAAGFLLAAAAACAVALVLPGSGRRRFF